MSPLIIGIITKHGTIPFWSNLLNTNRRGWSSLTPYVTYLNLPIGSYHGGTTLVLSRKYLNPMSKKSFQIFKTNFIPSEEENKFPQLAIFHSKFHFPWVFSWTLLFTSDPIHVIRRKFRVKRWGKYKIPSILYPSNILTWIKKKTQKFKHLTKYEMKHQIQPFSWLKNPKCKQCWQVQIWRRN